jgi:tetratricopeptide (TPR) repeat protein
MIRQVIIFAFLSFSLNIMSQSKNERSRVFYEDALAQYRSRDYASALDDLQEALNLQPNADVYYLEGMIYEALNQPLRALSAYEACVKLEENYSEAVFQKALIYLKHGDANHALKDFNWLLSGQNRSYTRGVYFQLDESGNNQNQIMSLETMESKLQYYRAETLMKLDETAKAIDAYKVSLSLEAHPDYFIGLGLVYFKIRNNELAKINFEEAIKIDRWNENGWYNLALLDPDIVIPDEVIALSEGGSLANLLASRAMEKEEYNRAIIYFDHIIKRNTKDALSYINRGRAKSKLGLFEDARGDFSDARKIAPRRAESLYLLGNCYFLEKNFSASLTFYDEYLALEPNNALIWYNAAMAHLELDQNQEACAYLNRASKYGMVQANQWKNKYCED